MKINVNNQKPGIINTNYIAPITGDINTETIMNNFISDVIFTPYGINDVTIVDDNSNQYNKDDINHWLALTIDETRDIDAETAIKSILRQTLIHYSPDYNDTPVDEIFVTQDASQKKLPAPSARIIYSPQSDIIPAAKEIIAGMTSDFSGLFTSIGLTFSPRTLGFAFFDDNAFSEFKEYLNTNITAINSQLSSDVINKFDLLQKIKLEELTESLLLRKEDSDDTDEYSFTRVLINQLSQFAQYRPDVCEMMPFSLAETIHPKSIVFINIERHARARASRIQKEWELINQSIKSPIKIISNKSLSKLTSVARATAKAQINTAKSNNGKKDHARSAAVQFRKNKPTNVDIFNDVLTVLKRMKDVRRSQNTYKTIKKSYMRANRRDPQNYNLTGKLTKTKYFSDIHIYADTSGSISERHYQDTVMMLIRLAKKMNVNIYFNSFSDVLSQESFIQVKHKSIKQIWKAFTEIPKVTGWTDYKQIWDYIEASPKRKKQLSIVITDFEWTPPSYRVTHPTNLYYAPSSMEDWDRLRHWCKQYVKTMNHIEPAIAQRILGMIL